MAVVSFLTFVCTSLSPFANAGIRAPGKYSGVVIYDRWGGCILFGGVYLGFQVQQNCVQEFDAHKPWTPGPLTNDGHAVFAVGYDHSGVTVLTWGNTQQGTWAWWDECVDEAYAILPPEAQTAGFAPGFDFAQLKADVQAVAD